MSLFDAVDIRWFVYDPVKPPRLQIKRGAIAAKWEDVPIVVAPAQAWPGAPPNQGSGGRKQ